jgi:hypothetical protein
MASKSASNRRPAATKKSSPAKTARQFEDEDTLDDSLAYEHGSYDEEDDSRAGLISRTSAGIRELTREREGQVVVAALATGFAVGVLIGGLIAHAHAREQTWSERLAHEGLGRRLLDRIGSAIPESISERIGR